MKLKEYLVEIEKFIKDYLNNSGQKSFVLGVSGGIDSALVAALTVKAVGKERLLALLMPIDSHESDLRDGLALVDKFGIPHRVIDLSDIYHSLCAKYEMVNADGCDLALNNTKVRLRMVTLYAFAQERGALVLGTDNADEIHVGYFTKYGDGAADLAPIAELNKGEVFEASRLLGVPDVILERVPTAGLFRGQTDEKELGVTYDQLDRYLLGEKMPETVERRIQELHRMSAHKRNPIPRPIKFDRTK